jgi:hypothetical protein
MTIRMSFEMRKAQTEEILSVQGDRRIRSLDYRQVKRQTRRMLCRAVRAAIASGTFVDWSLVVIYRQRLNRAKKHARENAVMAAHRADFRGAR